MADGAECSSKALHPKHGCVLLQTKWTACEGEGPRPIRAVKRATRHHVENEAQSRRASRPGQQAQRPPPAGDGSAARDDVLTRQVGSPVFERPTNHPKFKPKACTSSGFRPPRPRAATAHPSTLEHLPSTSADAASLTLHKPEAPGPLCTSLPHQRPSRVYHATSESLPPGIGTDLILKSLSNIHEVWGSDQQSRGCFLVLTAGHLKGKDHRPLTGSHHGCTRTSHHPPRPLGKAQGALLPNLEPLGPHPLHPTTLPGPSSRKPATGKHLLTFHTCSQVTTQ